MKLQTFKNMKGMIYGINPKRIGCDIEGVLRIGPTEVHLSPGSNSIMPQLFHGADGAYDATFADTNGNVYQIEKLTVKGGWIVPPPPVAVELMELRCRVDAAETECELMRGKMHELENAFDTDSLNFLIK